MGNLLPDTEAAETLLVTRGSGLMETRLGGELVGLHVENGTCYAFNAMATHIWTLLETPQTVAALRDTLLAGYAVDPATCEAEVRALLNDLASDGLVTITR